MSLQSGAPFTATSTFESDDDGRSGNYCPIPSSFTETTEAANAAIALHNIQDDAFGAEAVFSNPLAPNGTPLGENIPLRKRSSSCLHPSAAQQKPFLSSYGSAFLSGIFADIAEANVQTEGSDNFEPHTEPAKEDDDCFETYLPSMKKSRATHPTWIGGHTKSYKSMANLAGGPGGAATLSSHPVVSPRSNKCIINMFNGQVSKLQSLAFPSLPHLPATVSSLSLSTTNIAHVVTPRDGSCDHQSKDDEESDQKSSSGYGWFVSTDDDDIDIPSDGSKLSTGHAIQAQSNPALAFLAVTSPTASNHDTEVQQALAADTIDDVLGDFF